MTDYTKTTDFTSKDSLPSGDSGKIIRGAEFGTEFDNIQTAVNSKSNIDNPTFTGTITGNGSGLTNVAAASIDLTVSSDTDADYNVPFMNATGDGGSAKVLQVDDNGLMFNPSSNTLSVNRLKGNNDNLRIEDTSGNTILDIDTSALEIPVNTTITGTTAVTGNITVTGTVDGRDIAADGTKLDTVETNADVTDTANVTAAGALMDSELTSIASVKALNQGVATTNSPTFAGVTANGTVEFDGLSGTGAVTVTDILDQDDMSGNSATALATQQSIKAYVDSQVGTVDTLAEVLANGNATGGTDIAFGDNDKAIFGAGSDLQIYHDGSHNFIEGANAGNIYIRNQLDDGDIIIQSDDGLGGVANYVQADGSNGEVRLFHYGSEKLNTTSTGIDVTGTATATSLEATTATFEAGAVNVNFLETNTTDVNTRFRLNGGDFIVQTLNDAQDAVKSRLAIDNATGNVQFFEDTGTTAKFHWDASAEALGIGTTSPVETLSVAGDAIFTNDTAVTFGYRGTSGSTDLVFRDRYIGADRMRITSTGIDVTGTATMDGLTVSGVSTVRSGDTTNASLQSTTGDLVLKAGADDVILQTGGSGGEAIQFVDNAGALYFNANMETGDISFYEDTGTTAKFHWDAAGERLGLGTSSPDQELHVSASATPVIRIESRNNNLGVNESIGSLEFEKLDASGGGAGVASSINCLTTDLGGAVALSFQTGSSSGNNVERMRITSDGKVGIGTDDPDTKLMLEHTNDGAVGGTIRIKDRDSQQDANQLTGAIEFESQDATTPTSGVSTAIKAFAASSSGGSYLTISTTDVSTSTLDERLRITSDGLVGIGTSVPTNPLTVASSGSASYTSSKGIVADYTGSSVTEVVPIGFSWSSSTATQNPYWGMGLVPQNFSAGNADLGFYTTGTERLRIDASGNVGIGTTSPSSFNQVGTAPLMVIGTGSNSPSLTLYGGTSSSCSLAFADGTTTSDQYRGLIQYTHATDSLVFVSAATEACRIDSSQNLLVGKTAIGSTVDGFEARASGYTALSDTSGAALNVNRNTTDGNIVTFTKNGATVGSIGTAGSRPYISTPSSSLHSGLIFTDNGSTGIIAPSTNAGAVTNGTINLGYSAGRFKDLYLSGGAYLGGTAAANKLDDYEEGTWTPAYASSAGSFTTLTYDTSTYGKYTKVGNVCTVWGLIRTENVDVTGASGSLLLSGLPFTASGFNGIMTPSVVTNFAANDAVHSGYVQTGDTYINLRKRADSDGSTTGSAASDLSAGVNNDHNYMIFSMTYQTA